MYDYYTREMDRKKPPETQNLRRRVPDLGQGWGKRGHQASQSSEALFKELSQAGKEAYEIHRANLDDLAIQAECDSFIYGFRLGARMMLDVVGKQGEREDE